MAEDFTLSPSPTDPAAAAPPDAAPTLDENTQRRVDYAKWLTANKDKSGTPEFVKVADAYRQLSDATSPPAPGHSEAFNSLARVGARAGPLGAIDFGIAATNAGLNPFNVPADYIVGKLQDAGIVAPSPPPKPIPEIGNTALDALNVPRQAPSTGQGVAEDLASLAL